MSEKSPNYTWSMSGPQGVGIFLNNGGAELAAACRQACESLEIYRKEDLDQNPDLLARVQIVYGWLDPERWKEAPSLQWIQISGAGANGLLTPEVCASNVTITNVSGIHAAPITEHMFGMLLAYQRRLYAARDQQRVNRWDSGPLGVELPRLEGRTLGLLGVGAIGTHSARVGRAFGMRTVGYRRSDESHPDLDAVYGPGRLHEFLAECDIVMSTLPLSPHTKKILGREELAAMREGSILINTGRGGTIDTDALVDALKRGRPAAALLDVTDPEPLPAEHPLWQMENVIITPHYSGSHAGYSARAERIFLQNLEHYLRGEPLFNVVSKEWGY